jgi:ankyrin repeat protein
MTPVNIGDYGRALVEASSRGHEAIVRVLLESNAMTSTEITYGISLARASFHGHEEIVRLLLKNGASVNGEGFYGKFRPLHLASMNGCLEVARQLLNAGADATVEKEDGWTPLLFAVCYG